MRVAVMRWIDRWLGVPACAALTVLRRLGDLRSRSRRFMSKPIRRILFIKLAEQGATVLAYDALRRALRAVGRENVFFLVFEENRFILDAMDVIPRQNVIAIATAGLPGLATGTFRALRRVRSLRCDAAIDFEFFARGSAVLTYLSGAAVRVGLHGFDDGAPYRGDLMTHRIRYAPELHTGRLYSGMVEALALPPGEPALPPCADDQEEFPTFRPSPEELARIRSTLQRETGTEWGGPLVLLNANASDLLPLRRWPAERYVDVARRLLEQSPRLRVAFTGSPEEAPAADGLAAEVGSQRCFSMAGKTTLRELLALYHLADVLVTNDSGPAHFAALTPIRVVVLFGPEAPARFASRSPRTDVLCACMPCSPCVSAYNNRVSACADNQCMQRIGVEEVLEHVAAALAARESPPDALAQSAHRTGAL